METIDDIMENQNHSKADNGLESMEYCLDKLSNLEGLLIMEAKQQLI